MQVEAAAVPCLAACLAGRRPAGTHRRPCSCAQVEALHNLSYQLRQITHHEPFDHEKLAAKGEWLDAPDLITLVEKEKHKAIRDLQVTCRRRRQPPPATAAGRRCRFAIQWIAVMQSWIH